MENNEINDLETPFIAFTSDYGFKATFGNESDTLFLRKALQALIKSAIPIETVEFVKNDFQSVSLDSRSGVYDLACIDAAQNHFIVEMQVDDYPQFIQRMKFYAFHKFNTMVKKGKYFFTGLEPIYCIGILSKNIYPYPQYYSLGQMKNEQGYVMDPLLTYITVELDKFKVSATDIANDLEKLIFTMKNLQTYADRPATEFPEFWTEEWLKIAIEELDTRRFSPEQYERYAVTLARNASAIQMDQIKTLKIETEARAKALAEAKAEAEAEAATKEAQIILNLHKIGVSVANIAIATQKTEAEVEQIITKNKDKK